MGLDEQIALGLADQTILKKLCSVKCGGRGVKCKGVGCGTTSGGAALLLC